jgi:cell division protein FtsB
MALLREIRRRSRQVVPQVLMVCTLGYFAYHTIQGERGVLTWLRLEKDLSVAQASATVLEAERANLQRRVGLLRPESLDPDLLEERARVLLNYGADDEVVILFTDEGAPD